MKDWTYFFFFSMLQEMHTLKRMLSVQYFVFIENFQGLKGMSSSLRAPAAPSKGH